MGDYGMLCNNDIIDYLLLQLSYQSSVSMELVSYICQISLLYKDAHDSRPLARSNDNKEVPDQLAAQKIDQTFLDLLSKEESKLRFTQMILSHIRSLPLELGKRDVDCKLVDKLCRNFLGEKDTLLPANKESIAAINFFWLLQTHCNHISDSPYILEEVVDYVITNSHSTNSQRKYPFYCRLLASTIQVFL